LVGGWWPFLLSALVAYGLLPRCLTLAFASVRAARSLARIPFDDAEVARLVRRLSAPRLDTRGAGDESIAPGPAAATLPGQCAMDGTRCQIVLWRDAPARPELKEAVARQTRCSVAGTHAAGGRDYEDGTLDWRPLADGSDAAVIVAEGWEAPDKAVLRLLTDLRRALGPRRPILVLLGHIREEGIGPSPASELRIWQEALAPLEDPWLGVEPLRGVP
jgi:hypothetical protein